MYYTTQVQMVIEIKPLLMKHVFAIYNNEDTNFENPEHKEMEDLQGYEIVYHDIDKLPYDITNYRNLTFTIEGKTCSLVNYDDKQKNEFYRDTKGCILPNNVELCRFIDNKLFEDDINFESKDDFQSILNDWFSYEYDRQNELKRKLHEVSTPTPPLPAEVKGYDLGLDNTQLKTLHRKLIEGTFLDGNTKLGHLINAFNGEVLVNFEPLKWTNPTMGAVFFFHVKKTKNTEWTKYSYLFEPANYKQLLSQSRGNGTFENLTTMLEKLFYRPL